MVGSEPPLAWSGNVTYLIDNLAPTHLVLGARGIVIKLPLPPWDLSQEP